MVLNSNYSEQEIVQGCIKENRKFQEILYRNYADKMYGICKGYSNDHDTAKDILQEGFIKIFKNIKSFKGECLLEGWIKKIIVNTAIDFYRKSVRQMSVVELEDHRVASVENDILEQFKVEDLLKIIYRLPEGARLIFNLYAVEGYTHREIAEKLKITEGTSKSQFARARKLMQNWILSGNEIIQQPIANAV